MSKADFLTAAESSTQALKIETSRLQEQLSSLLFAEPAGDDVSRAASKLHVSQPGISRQIHDLEDEIGFLLFQRSGKSVRLTVPGNIFFGEARDILQRTADVCVGSVQPSRQ